MERLLDALRTEAEGGLTPRSRCGCGECLRARQLRIDVGSCRSQARRLEAFLQQRLRETEARGAESLSRLAEEARRYARLLVRGETAAAQDPASGWSRERPLDSFLSSES